MSVTPEQRWETALANASDGLSRAGYQRSTVERVLKHARKFAVESGIADPWCANPDDLANWLDSVSGPHPARAWGVANGYPNAHAGRLSKEVLRAWSRAGRPAMFPATSGRAVSSYRASLRTFYRWAHSVGRVESDPAAGIDARPNKLVPPPVWREPIAAYRRWLLASGCSWQTLESRCYQIARLARELPTDGPWSVTAEDLAEWMARHRWTRETARSHRNGLRSFYAWAAKVGRITSDPSQLLPPIRLPDQIRRPATDATYVAALAAARPREALMLRLAAELGLRRTEIVTLQRRNLNEEPDGHWLSVKGKGGKLRYLPVPRPLALAILAWCNDQHGSYLFPGGKDGHLDPRTAGRLCSAALPPGITLHALRHRFATVAYAANCDLFATQRLLGHSNPSTTQRYVHTSDAALRAAVIAAARVDGEIGVGTRQGRLGEGRASTCAG